MKREENSLLVKSFSEATQKELQGKKAGDALVIQLSKAFDKTQAQAIVKDLALPTTKIP